jgi:hypothetical protein
MNLRYLGDALDYWKGSLFFRLQAAGVFEDLSIDPMLTDQENWRSSDFKLYADLLQVRPDQVLYHKLKLKENRENYFAEIIRTGDLFIDPDTGISLTHNSPAENYIRISEINQLLSLPITLCIYQHVSREKTSERVSKLVVAIRDTDSKVHCCSYETPNVAMLFFSKKESRLERLSECFKNYLGRHASKRVKNW